MARPTKMHWFFGFFLCTHKRQAWYLVASIFFSTYFSTNLDLSSSGPEIHCLLGTLGSNKCHSIYTMSRRCWLAASVISWLHSGCLWAFCKGHPGLPDIAADKESLVNEAPQQLESDSHGFISWTSAPPVCPTADSEPHLAKALPSVPNEELICAFYPSSSYEMVTNWYVETICHLKDRYLLLAHKLPKHKKV